eukprot:TRINITY_DN2853_c0_g1_i1.p1 TRINITY_DN2853_c0_g1~~TRINITY_DN2853_c0_g1_i1.p1  ORF type:complete len:132 (+),score=50.67 TRINITY_DN2853_c0_g1_i1:36-398(+)
MVLGFRKQQMVYGQQDPSLYQYGKQPVTMKKHKIVGGTVPQSSTTYGSGYPVKSRTGFRAKRWLKKNKGFQSGYSTTPKVGLFSRLKMNLFKLVGWGPYSHKTQMIGGPSYSTKSQKYYY